MFIYNIFNTYYEVIFYDYDNTIIEVKKVKTGKVVLEPASPQKEGYNFIGWYDGEEDYDFTTLIYENLNLYAKYEIIEDYVFKHIVTFDSNYGSDIPYQTVEHGGTATVPTPPYKNGYTFVEWRLNGSKYDFNSPVTSDMTLIAHWTVALSDDEVNMNKAKDELKDFSIDTNSPNLVNTLVDGKCSVTFDLDSLNLSTITRDITDKIMPAVAKITCGSVSSTKQINITIKKSTYTYILKDDRYLYAYDNNNLLSDYVLYDSNDKRISASKKCTEGSCISVTVGKLNNKETYYLVFNNNPNIKYALVNNN